MTNQTSNAEVSSDERAPSRIAFDAAMAAAGIGAVAEMLSVENADCEDPCAAALLIARQANELNGVLYDLSVELEGSGKASGNAKERSIAATADPDKPETVTINGEDFPVEVACRAIDAVIGNGAEPPAPEADEETDSTDETDEEDEPDLFSIALTLEDRVTLAEATVNLIAGDDSAEPDIANAARGVVRHLEEAKELIADIHAWRRKNESKPRDVVNNGTDRTAEMFELLDRMLALPEDSGRDLFLTYAMMRNASPESRAEVADLRKRGLYFDNISAFLTMRERGEVQFAPKAGEQ